MRMCGWIIFRTVGTRGATNRILPVAAKIAFVFLVAAPFLAAAARPAAAQQPAPAPADTARVDGDDPVRSPRDAFLRSLVVPGWGQAWVGAPVRGGVYFAMEAGALWMTYKSRQKLREARLEEQWLRESGQLPLGQPYPLARAREDQVEDWLTLSIFFLFFAGADAFVSAHLADFGERVGGGPMPGGGVQMQARIPVGGRP
jgi:hypothetical protein